MTKLRVSLSLCAAVLLCLPAAAQNRTRFAGRVNAIDYAYGISGQAPGPLQIATGNAATGAATITIVAPGVVLGDGTTVYPLSTVAPITIGTGSTKETITPTTLSNCNYAAPYGSCAVTATFTYTHGTGEYITTGTYGLQEAINSAQAAGGGAVGVSPTWATSGGTSALIAAAKAYSAVWVEDLRGQNSSYGNLYWTMQPSTLTSLAVPTTLVAANVVFAAAPVGTWANSAYYFCVTYVDALGGEGPCSLTYTQTPTLNYSATISSPAASTGAVGWRAYAGTGSLATAYLLPITSTVCTLTTLESVMPACAIGASGLFLAPNVTTTALKPNTQTTPSVNVYQTFPQGHTTFAYQPTSGTPQPFQQHYGPFTAYGSLTSGQVAILGSVNLPTGYLNTIGRTVRVRGKVTLGSTNTATLPTLNISLGWAGGDTAGAPVNLCNFEGVAIGSTKVYNGQFECTLTTNAVGATAVGTIQPAGFLMLQDQGIAANGIGPYIDTNTAAVGSLGLQVQDILYVLYTSTTNSTAAPQLLDLHVETLQ